MQASPYGTDNACMLEALQRLKGRARGVAVIDQDTSLIPMHGLGVRGVRVNLQTGGERDPNVARRLPFRSSWTTSACRKRKTTSCRSFR